MKAKSNWLPNRVAILATGYASLFLITLWAAYTNRLPAHLLNQIPYYDKIGHIILYWIASYLGHQVLNGRHYRVAGKRWPVFPSIFSLFTLTEEIIQGFSPYRTLDAGDLICSGIGILIGYALAEWQRHSQT